MAGFTIDTTIAHPPERVFDYVTDPRNALDAMADIVEVEPLHEPLAAVGGRWRETRRTKGKDHSVDLEVVELERPVRYAVGTRAEGFDIVYRYDLEAAQEGTLVRLRCEVSGSGLKRMMAPMVAMALKSQDGEHLEMIKAAMG